MGNVGNKLSRTISRTGKNTSKIVSDTANSTVQPPRKPPTRSSQPVVHPANEKLPSFVEAFGEFSRKHEDEVKKVVEKEKMSIIPDAPPPTKYRSLVDAPLPVRQPVGMKQIENPHVAEDGKLTTKQLVKLMAECEKKPTPTVGELASRFNLEEKMVHDIVKFTWPIATDTEGGLRESVK
eukprot:g496.t1